MLDRGSLKLICIVLAIIILFLNVSRSLLETKVDELTERIDELETEIDSLNEQHSHDIEIVADERFHDGCSAGYDDGYDEGYADGYREGYNDGTLS